MPKSISDGIRELSQKLDSSVFITLFGLVNFLLYKYSGQTDIVVGTPAAGREHMDLSDQIGFFVNTLAIRNTLEKNQTCARFLSSIRENVLSSFEHQSYPFDLLLKELNIARDTSRHPLFDVMVSYQNNNDISPSAHHSHNGGENDAAFTELPGEEVSAAKFDLTFGFVENQDNIIFSIEYRSDIFERPTISRMMIHFETICREFISHPEAALEAVEMASEQERDVLRSFNNTSRPFALTPIHELFEQTATAKPDHVALVYDGRELTYDALNRYSNRIAHVLRDTIKVKPDDVVAIRIDRSFEMMAGLLGILKSGA
ncbi:MAG: condensation domain-containing protein, partial [Flammeovirgaceae bacterium]